MLQALSSDLQAKRGLTRKLRTPVEKDGAHLLAIFPTHNLVRLQNTRMVRAEGVKGGLEVFPCGIEVPSQESNVISTTQAENRAQDSSCEIAFFLHFMVQMETADSKTLLLGTGKG